MISKFSAIPFASVAMLCGTMAIPVGAVQPVATHPFAELRSDSNRPIAAQGYRVRDDHAPKNRPSTPAQSSKGGEDKKQLDQLQQQLATKDSELAALREKILVANELLNVEKRQMSSLETLLIQKERELTALRDQGHSENKAAKSTPQPAKSKADDFERQLLADNLENAKRRIGELIIQLYAKEGELTALRSSAHESAKQLHANLDAQSEELLQAKHRLAELEPQTAGGRSSELAQARRRIADLEQQTVGREQELAHAKRRVDDLEQQIGAAKTPELLQAKRRIADLEQLTMGRDQELAHAKRRMGELEQQMAGLRVQELAQAKRRITELEQQTVGKEQELARVKDDLKQISQKLDELTPVLTARTAELEQTKQSLAELERNSFKIVDPTTVQLNDTDPANQRVAEADLPLSTPTHPNSTGPNDADAARGNLSKMSESLARLLQPELSKGSVAMRRRGHKLTLAFAAGALFSPGEAMMTVGGSALLERVGSVLRGFRYQNIEVAAQSDIPLAQQDPKKSTRDNTDLSQTRAERTSQALINGGIEGDRVKTVSPGASKPSAANEAEKGGGSRAPKVEIVILAEPEPAANATPSRLGKKPQALSTEKVVNR